MKHITITQLDIDNAGASPRKGHQWLRGVESIPEFNSRVANMLARDKANDAMIMTHKKPIGLYGDWVFIAV